MTGSTPTLRKGSRGEAVTRLQEGLAHLSYDPGPIDGIFGAGTKAAVTQFQSDRELDVDGIVGPDTWSALEEAFTMLRADEPNV